MDKISNERKAQIFYQGNGSQTQYSFPFDYLRKAFVHVSLISNEKIEELTQGTDFTVTDRVVTLAAPTGLKIKIYRQTATKPLVGWADASVLKAADMTVQSTQLLHLAEETSDLAQEGGLSKDGTDNIWDARYNKIKNLLDPTDPGDAVNLNYITKNQTSLLTQLNNTGAAQNASIVSTGDSQNARLTSTGDTQNTRLNTTGDTQDKRLNDLGQKYVDLMTTLKDTATTKATEAGNSAELSKKWAMSDTSPDGVTENKSAKTWAGEAKTSASNSATSASASQSSASASSASATQSSNSASASKSSASASASSASASAASASAASTSASNAKTSETNAAKSATAAAQSAENAKLFDPSSYAKRNEVFPITDTGRKIVEEAGITDLNEVKCISYPSWLCRLSATTSMLSNCPTKTAFFLYNMRNGFSSDKETLPNLTSYWYYSVQILIDITGNTWLRACFNSQKEKFTFGTWKKIASLADLPTKLSQLTNDSNYATTNDVGTAVAAEAKKWKDAYNNLRKRSTPAQFDDAELTELMLGAVGNGNITLLQPYTDFDGLLIDYTSDNGNFLSSAYISTAELNRRVAVAKSVDAPVIFLFDSYYFWTIYITEAKKFSPTYFPYEDDNCVIQQIYGVKLKEIT